MGLPAALGRTRRLRDLGGASAGLGADDLANSGLPRAARQEVRALRAERDFTQARINVLKQVVEDLQERERELTGKEWGAEDFEGSEEDAGRPLSSEEEDAEGESDKDYEEAAPKKKSQAARGGGKRKGN